MEVSFPVFELVYGPSFLLVEFAPVLLLILLSPVFQGS